MTGRSSDPALRLDWFKFSPGMLAITDLRGTLIALNPAWLTALDRDGATEQPARFVDLVHRDDRSDVEYVLTQAAAGAAKAAGEHRFARADGWRTLTWRAARGGDVLHLSATDVAERDTARQELDALIASVSHDLRAPLRAVDGFAQLLLQSDAAADLPADVHRAVTLVTEASAELARLLDALVEVVRVARGPFAPGRVDIEQLVRDTIDRALPAAHAQEVRWTVGELPPAWGDVTLLSRLLTELLRNALRFTAERDVAHIEVGWDASEAAYVVRDDGIGFDDARTDQAFAIFGRLRRSTEDSGTGIGLPIAERIVARHGGRIWARSQPGEGAAFWFTLPDPQKSF